MGEENEEGVIDEDGSNEDDVGHSPTLQINNEKISCDQNLRAQQKLQSKMVQYVSLDFVLHSNG